MKLLCKWERPLIKVGIYHVLFGSLPQLALAWQFFDNGAILDAITLSPFVTLLAVMIPGYIVKRIIFFIATFGEDREYVWENWSESEPLLFSIPLFEVHSGVFFLFKIIITMIIRFFIAVVTKFKGERTLEEDDDNCMWHSTAIYLLIDPS